MVFSFVSGVVSLVVRFGIGLVGFRFIIGFGSWVLMFGFVLGGDDCWLFVFVGLGGSILVAVVVGVFLVVLVVFVVVGVVFVFVDVVFVAVVGVGVVVGVGRYRKSVGRQRIDGFHRFLFVFVRGFRGLVVGVISSFHVGFGNVVGVVVVVFVGLFVVWVRHCR